MQTVIKLQILPLWNFYMLLGGWQRCFPSLNNNESCDPKARIRGQSNGQNVITSKHAYSGNFFTKMESLGNFLQTDTKFVQIPQVVAEIL